MKVKMRSRKAKRRRMEKKGIGVGGRGVRTNEGKWEGKVEGGRMRERVWEREKGVCDVCL